MTSFADPAPIPSLCDSEERRDEESAFATTTDEGRSLAALGMTAISVTGCPTPDEFRGRRGRLTRVLDQPNVAGLAIHSRIDEEAAILRNSEAGPALIG